MAAIKGKQIIQVLRPVAGTGSAVTTAYVDCSDVHSVAFVYQIYDGHATSPTITVLEATDTSGTSAATLGKAFRIYTNTDALNSTTLTRQTDAASYSLTNTASTKTKLVVIEVDCSLLSSGYNALAVALSASNSSNIHSMTAICESRYAPI